MNKWGQSNISAFRQLLEDAAIKVRQISYAAYNRNPDFWIDQQAKGVEIEVMRGGKVCMVLYGEPEVCEETWDQKLRRNKIMIQPSRRQKEAGA